MAANDKYNSIKESTLSSFFSTLKAFFWKAADVVNLTLGQAAVKDVDSTPTANSTNLVESGGVKSYVDNAIPTVPTISTNIVSDKTSDTKTASPKAVYTFVKPDTASSIPAGGLVSGVKYRLGTLTGSQTITLASPTDANVENEYKFTFTAGSTPPSITWPASITEWAGNVEFQNGLPIITASKTYEVNIEGGIAFITKCR